MIQKQTIREIGIICVSLGMIMIVFSLIHYEHVFVALGGILVGLGLSNIAKGISEYLGQKQQTKSEFGSS